MEIEQEANAVKISQDLHKQSSYYNSTRPLSKEAQQLLLTEKLITSGGTPELVSERIKAPEQIHKSITKYKFMNDGMWMKILIDRNDYPEFQHTSIQQMNAQFQIDSFDFVVQVNDLLDYSLRVTKLREKINPEKSKIYERKTYIYIALYKEKEGDWWSLKY